MCRETGGVGKPNASRSLPDLDQVGQIGHFAFDVVQADHPLQIGTDHVDRHLGPARGLELRNAGRGVRDRAHAVVADRAVPQLHRRVVGQAHAERRAVVDANASHVESGAVGRLDAWPGGGGNRAIGECQLSIVDELGTGPVHVRPQRGDAPGRQNTQRGAACLDDLRVDQLAPSVTRDDAVAAGSPDHRALERRTAAGRDVRTVTGHVGHLHLPERRLCPVDDGDAVRLAVGDPHAREDRPAVAIDPDAVLRDIGHHAVLEPASGFGRHRDTAAAGPFDAAVPKRRLRAIGQQDTLASSVGD